MRWHVPEGWRWATVGEVAEIVGGGTPTASDATNFDDNGIPWITPADLSGYSGANIERGARSLSQKGYDTSGARLMPARTVLFSSRAPIGYCVIARNPVATNQGFKSLVLGPSLLPEFVRHYLLGAKRYIEEFASGTTFKEISGRRMAEVELPVPPLDEQHRIVSAIEMHFSRLDAAVASLTRAKANVKRARASVLKAAVEGRLVSTEATLAQTEGRDYEPASVLLARILAERKAAWAASGARGKYNAPVEPETAGLPQPPPGWCWTTFDAISECLDRLRRPVNKAERAGRLGNIPYYGANGQVGWIDEALFDEPLVLVVEDETFTGRTKPFSYVIRGKSWVNNHAHVLRPSSPLSVEFLDVLLAKYPFVPLTTGTTGRKKLTQKALMEAPVRLPPLAEQRRIVAEVDRRLSVLDAIGVTFDANLARCARLRQAVLKRAFEGRLMPAELPTTDTPRPDAKLQSNIFVSDTCI